MPFMVANVGKDGMAHFKKYSSFSEKRYAFARVKWQISVQPCIIIYRFSQA